MSIVLRRRWTGPLLAALAISSIGDEITLITLTFRTAGTAAWAIPVLLIGQLVPALVAAPFAGRLVDRGDAARLLMLASAAQALVVMLLALTSSIVGTLAGAAVLGLLFAISGTATFALIPAVAEARGMTLPRANALLEVIRSGGMLAGPVIGGLLVALGGSRLALVIDAISFALFALVLFASGLRRDVPKPPVSDAKTGVLADYLTLLRNRYLTVLVGVLSVEVIASAIADVAFVFLVTFTLRAGATTLGVLTACWAAGMLAGAALAARVPTSRAAAAAFGSAAVMGATMVAIGLSPLSGLAGAIGVGLAFSIGGGANSVHNASVRTILQLAAPENALGRTAAIYVGATRAATIVGFVVGGLFIPDHAPAAYLLGGAASVIAALVGWRVFRKRVKQLR